MPPRKAGLITDEEDIVRGVPESHMGSDLHTDKSNITAVLLPEKTCLDSLLTVTIDPVFPETQTRPYGSRATKRTSGLC